MWWGYTTRINNGMSEALRKHLCSYSDVCRKRGIALGSVQKALSVAMMLEVLPNTNSC